MDNYEACNDGINGILIVTTQVVRLKVFRLKTEGEREPKAGIQTNKKIRLFTKPSNM